ncbi:MAG TPA: phosphoribosylaminoimidazolesuccinocarboxamide synthase [Bacillota bacterium]|nr:phosphoribosylaminoimidazolesuccinocarboxamide synthase [Bacillota bacterium]HOL09647.1 phosphoribosylaminoimidazolesuccinocarboxamide synthase [Bacillota bacterium]HPO97500.1 phosphoribosylaminoimidazolesuccinocarboxamide synthase [Bacillota bacterium]
MRAVNETKVKTFPLIARGKVRDVYDLNHYLLIVATDRISAFDVVFDQPIPNKGKVLTALSVYWFEQTKAIMPNHLVTANIDEVPGLTGEEREILRGRSMLVKKGQVVPIECVVRGYLTGGGLKEYQQAGTVCGIKLPSGLVDGSKLPEPIFTPTTKESVGHDRPITFAEMAAITGRELAEQLRDKSLSLYKAAAQIAEARGIIIADTKFEFAHIDGELTVVDEIFTPDSSRFWPLAQYQPGKPQPSFDKQYVRDYLEKLDWNKQPPAPTLPEDVIKNTLQKYLEAYERIVGKPLEI